MNEVKITCPYCGSSKWSICHEKTDRLRIFYVECNDCHATAPPSFCHNQAKHNATMRKDAIPEGE